MAKSTTNRLWVEEHRPKVINDIIFKNDELKKKFNSMVKARDIPNLLFSGVQGSGKTTLSQAIINELQVHPADVLVINASDERGIDAMRDKITGFAQTMPLGDIKIVRLEEMDMLTPAAQPILRKIIEDSSDTCRFICTCNYANRIIPALKSRLQEYVFSAPDFDQVFQYAFDILTKEEIDVSSDQDIDLLEKFVTSAYPDIRKIVQLLQQHSQDGKLSAPNGNTSNDDYKFKLLEFLEQDDYISIRKTLVELIPADDYDSVFEFLYKNIHKSPKFKDGKNEAQAIVLIADHLYKNSLVAHQHINLAALFINLGNL